MDTSKLTVNLPDAEIEFLTQYAQKNKTSVSELVAGWIKALKRSSKSTLHPDIEKFTGIISPDMDVDRTISDYIAEKHQ